jgi:hypothetical protein
MAEFANTNTSLRLLDNLKNSIEDAEIIDVMIFSRTYKGFTGNYRLEPGMEAYPKRINDYFINFLEPFDPLDTTTTIKENTFEIDILIPTVYKNGIGEKFKVSKSEAIEIAKEYFRRDFNFNRFGNNN